MLTADTISGFLAFVLLVSVPVAAVLGVVIRRRYRKAVGLAMARASSVSEDAFDVPPAKHPNSPRLNFDVTQTPVLSPIRWDLAGRYFVSGVAYSVVTVVILFALNELTFGGWRLAVVLGSFAFTAAIMALYVSGLRWFFVLAGAIFWIWVLSLVTADVSQIIGILVGPALFMSFIVGNPALRTSAIPLFFIALCFTVPLVFSLELVLGLMVWGVLDAWLLVLPPGLVGAAYVLLGLLLTLAIGAILAWISLKAVARITAGSSELMMQHDLLWLFQTLWLIGLGWTTSGALTLLFGLAFVAYRITLYALRPKDTASQTALLLRVFGQQRAQTSLARSMLLNWRRSGPVLLIGAEDLATETLDAPELSAFLNRRLSDIFIETPQDLAHAIQSGEIRHGDGLFPMRDFYCRDNSWRPTVLTLMDQAHRVLVDMRGLDATHGGIQFEIDALAQRVRADRILVVSDAEDLSRVQNMFSIAWSQAPGQDRENTIKIIAA